MKKSTAFKLFVSTLLMLGSVAHAGTTNSSVRDDLTHSLGQVAIKKVIADSKVKSSALRAILSKYNLVDGRNNSGTINVPLSASDIKVTLLSGVDQFGSYCSPKQESETELVCNNGRSAKFLVGIASSQNVHNAVEFDAVTILVEVTQTTNWIENNEKALPAATSVQAHIVKEIKIDSN